MFDQLPILETGRVFRILEFTTLYNYKVFFRMILLTVCDAPYCFTLDDVGEYGSNNDCGILSNSKIGSRFVNGEISVPESEIILGHDSELLYFLATYKIFPLETWLMRLFF